MSAVDTIGLFATAGAASPFPTALGPASGDSLTVRAFPDGQTAAIESIIYNPTTAQKFRLSSPNMHDNVTGLTYFPGEFPAQFLVPRDVEVNVVSGDNLVAQGGIAAAGTIQAALGVYYNQLAGISQRLHSWGDISGNVKYIKPVEVDLAAIAVGAWTDTLLTTTENQLHAHADYAVLGYQCSQTVDVVGVKGSFTGNLRVCGPGPISTLDISEYFIRMSELNHKPYIPVFNSDDRFAIYVSAMNHAAIAGGAATVILILAQLINTLTP